MKKIANTILVAFSIFISIPTFAVGGNELGNGGDVFYCPNAVTDKVILVDIYEAKLAQRKMIINSTNGNYKDRVKQILDRWQKISPLRVEQYLIWLEAFESEATFISKVDLPNINDEGIVVKPKDCEIHQIAIQLDEQDLGAAYKRYTINKDLWDLLDESNKAALVLHELIFREAINSENQKSIRVRFLNGILLSLSTVEEYFYASANLDGMFLEWGWAGLSANVILDSLGENVAKFKGASLKGENFMLKYELRPEQVWLKNKTFNIQCKNNEHYSIEEINYNNAHLYLSAVCHEQWLSFKFDKFGEINFSQWEQLHWNTSMDGIIQYTDNGSGSPINYTVIVNFGNKNEFYFKSSIQKFEQIIQCNGINNIIQSKNGNLDSLNYLNELSSSEKTSSCLIQIKNISNGKIVKSKEFKNFKKLKFSTKGSGISDSPVLEIISLD